MEIRSLTAASPIEQYRGREGATVSLAAPLPPGRVASHYLKEKTLYANPYCFCDRRPVTNRRIRPNHAATASLDATEPAGLRRRDRRARENRLRQHRRFPHRDRRIQSHIGGAQQRIRTKEQ